LLGRDDAPVEGEFPVFKDAELQCTETGQVLSALKGESVFDFIAAREKELAAGRKAPTREELVGAVRLRIGDTTPRSSRKYSIVRGHTLTKNGRDVYELQPEPGIRLPVVIHQGPEAGGPSVVVVHGDGKSAAVQGTWLHGAWDGFVLDLRGMGELAPEGKDAVFGTDWKEAFLGIHLMRPLLGQRILDLRSLELSHKSLVGVGSAGPVVLHAAVLEETVDRVTVEGSVLSWSSVARASMTRNQLSNAVPGVLLSYDLPDLAAALAPRPLTIRNPVDPMGKPVTQAELEKAYAKVREAYKAAGAEKNLVLEVKP
ncbi:MAG TPA: metalloendopeptidase, partial [Planctomycetota bacterium]|nr:metalloendopeptidase [Planctomycetota bacterium]